MKHYQRVVARAIIRGVYRPLYQDHLSTISLLPILPFRHFLGVRRNREVKGVKDRSLRDRGIGRKFFLRVFKVGLRCRAKIAPFQATITKQRTIRRNLLQAANYQGSGATKARTRAMRTSFFRLLCRVVFYYERVFTPSILIVMLCLISRR